MVSGSPHIWRVASELICRSHCCFLLIPYPNASIVKVIQTNEGITYMVSNILHTTVHWAHMPGKQVSWWELTILSQKTTWHSAPNALDTAAICFSTSVSSFPSDVIWKPRYVNSNTHSTFPPHVTISCWFSYQKLGVHKTKWQSKTSCRAKWYSLIDS